MSGPCSNCSTLAAALKGADAEIARLRAQAALPTWWCTIDGCDRWNVGGDTCGRCGKQKPKGDVR